MADESATGVVASSVSGQDPIDVEVEFHRRGDGLEAAARWALIVAAVASGAYALSPHSLLRAAVTFTAMTAAVLLLAGLPRRRELVADPPPDWLLARELARCRRREEEAHVLVMDTRRPRQAVEQLVNVFRVTDAVMVERRRVGGCRIVGVIDARAGGRLALEARLRAALGEPSTLVGWATFPADGLTLAVLVAEASRAALSHLAGEPPRAVTGRRLRGAETSAPTGEGS